MAERKEVWLRGEKTAGMSPLLQPVADALLEAGEEIASSLQDFPGALLWEKPATCAAVGFHLKHIAGFLDRLLSYAEGSSLTGQQFAYLGSEVQPDEEKLQTHLVRLTATIGRTIERLKLFPESSLAELRGVGRAALPSTVIGLLVHAAEHTMRHTGQLLVTVKVLQQGYLPAMSSPPKNT